MAHTRPAQGQVVANALASESSPYLLQHADNPVDWLPWGPEAFERARGARQAGVRLDRLLRLPLVPRDGAGVLRGPGHGGADERGVRMREGRPRGASRRGRPLHGGACRHDGPGRVAAERVPDPRAAAVLRGHLLPPRAPQGMPAWRRCWRRSRRPGASDREQIGEAARAAAPSTSRATPATRPDGPLAESLLGEAVARAGETSTPATGASGARRSSPGIRCSSS